MRPFDERYSVMRATASFTSHSSVLICTSGLSGASYGADIPVKSVRPTVSPSHFHSPALTAQGHWKEEGNAPLISPARAFL